MVPRHLRIRYTLLLAKGVPYLELGLRDCLPVRKPLDSWDCPASQAGRPGTIGRTERVRENQPNLQKDRKNGSVIVVGGSAAGLLTAARVAAGGRDVRVLDAKSGLDPAPRSLIVTHHFREQLREVAASSIVNEIRRFELFTDGRSAEVALRRPDLII